jgi:hypothetical protein
VLDDGDVLLEVPKNSFTLKSKWAKPIHFVIL